MQFFICQIVLFAPVQSGHCRPGRIRIYFMVCQGSYSESELAEQRKCFGTINWHCNVEYEDQPRFVCCVFELLLPSSIQMNRKLFAKFHIYLDVLTSPSPLLATWGTGTPNPSCEDIHFILKFDRCPKM